MKLRLVTFVLLFLIGATAFAGGQPDRRSHIPASELMVLIQADRAPTVVDVRSRSEFQKGHVPGALHIPFWAAFGRSRKIDSPRDEPIVVYCEHGPRAGLAKAAFRISGFKQVLYLEGHMSGWKKAGLPLDVVPAAR